MRRQSGVVGDRLEALGVVITARSKNLDGIIGDMNLHLVAV